MTLLKSRHSFFVLHFGLTWPRWIFIPPPCSFISSMWMPFWPVRTLKVNEPKACLTLIFYRATHTSTDLKFKFLTFFFMKYYRMGPLQNAQNHELESKRTRCYVEAKYFCHIKYDGNQFRYVVQEIIQLSSKSKSWKLFCLRGFV